MSKESTGSQAQLGQGEGAAQPQKTPSPAGPLGNPSFRSAGPGHPTHSLQEFVVTVAAQGHFLGGRKKRILILHKLTMINIFPKANIYFHPLRTTQIQPCILFLKSSRLTRSPRLSHGLISRVNGKAQKELRHYLKKKKSNGDFFSPKETASESWSLNRKGSDAWDPKEKALHATTHTPGTTPRRMCVCVCVRGGGGYMWRVGAGLYSLLQLQNC